MNRKNDKKVLIVGSSASDYSLAKKISELKEVTEVFVAPGNNVMKDFSTVVDIRENNIQELLEFALENAIDLTITSSDLAITNDIASIFSQNGQMVFAPTKSSANICINKSVGKKFMYKNHILCPKFGIFDKPSLAIDYIKKSNFPVVIKTDTKQENDILVCNSFTCAKNFIEQLFDAGEKKVIIEDYIFGHEFSFYVITDGYHALPLGSIKTYKYELEGNGGSLSSGMGAFVPDYKISAQIEKKIMQYIVYPALNSLSRQQMPYVGILGIDLILTDNQQLFTINFNSSLKSPDTQGILALLNENIYNLFQACTIGSFADDYSQLDIEDKYAASCVICAKKSDEIINGYDNLDEDTKIAHFKTRKNAYLEYETTTGRNIILTRTARVLSKAIENMYDEVSCINFEGIKYRKDIGTILV